ncbi:hypothetical protein QFC21_001071 [Naganishia friedmannii]|uniref:Uncharacterized protein n=1 Tax=Naganishia friedmannii TaxID=89922 RepID=A0ACC2WAI9_9TREE|nr:hypothetical protein QFC21_001071 [Naganishia friedmannii]
MSLKDILVRLFVLAVLSAWSGIASPFPGNDTEKLASRADHKYDSQTPAGDLVCRPFGECEPCPLEEIYQPYCHPYGNRRLVHCVPHKPHDDATEEAGYGMEDDYFASHKDATSNHAHIGSGSKAVPQLKTSEGQDQNGDKVYITSWQGKKISWADVEGEVPAWESCGKVILLERESYWRFVTYNILFLILSVVILLIRANKLAAIQYRQLAARIGIVRGA